MLLVFFLIYLALAGRWAAIILDRVFDLKNSFSKFLLGTFAAFASVGTVAGVVILFYPLTFSPSSFKL